MQFTSVIFLDTYVCSFHFICSCYDRLENFNCEICFANYNEVIIKHLHNVRKWQSTAKITTTITFLFYSTSSEERVRIEFDVHVFKLRFM